MSLRVAKQFITKRRGKSRRSRPNYGRQSINHLEKNMADMSVDIFAEFSYGKVALRKIEPTSSAFRLYEAGWLGNHNERNVMEVTGGEFRVALSGKNKGKLTILIPGSSCTVQVTVAEMDKQEEQDGLRLKGKYREKID